MALTIVAVVLLGMALIVYNEYNTTPPAPPVPSDPMTQTNQATTETPTMPDTPSDEKLDQPTAEKSDTTETATTPPPAEDIKQWESNAPLAPVAPSPIAKEQETESVEQKPESIPTSAENTHTQPSKEDMPKVEKPKPVQEVKQAQQIDPKPAEQSTPTPKKATSKEIKKITIATIGDGVTVRIDSLERPDYKAMRLNAPERIVLDFNGDWKVKAPGVPKNEFVSNVRIGVQKDGTRIVIDLKKAPASIRYLKYGETGLDVRIR